MSTSPDSTTDSFTPAALDDAIQTIAAIATPPGAGGVGIVRISGPAAFAVGLALFRRAHGTVDGEGAPPTHQLTHGQVVDPATGEVVDEVLAAFMRAPHTYTREDIVELNAHGGPLVLRRILALALAHGARAAQAGEMTLRAFLNGRLDLAQAEAVMALINAESDAALRLAQRQLSGELSARVGAVRTTALAAMVRIEASNDFPEEEVPQPDRAELSALVEKARAGVEELLAGADRGRLLREGVRVAIVGRPNVGKSSLLNALLRAERAIVTPFAGTTRDTVEALATIQGVALHLVDTAGLTASDDPVERIGVERARAAAGSADLALFVLDASQPLTPADRAAADDLRALGFGQGTALDAPERDGTTPRERADAAYAGDAERALLLVLNKADLPAAFAGAAAHALWPSAPIIHSSTVAAGGIASLEQAIAGLVLGGQTSSADPLVASVRHRDALRRAAASLTTAAGALAGVIPLDFVALDLREALDALGEITGETATADLLDRIFAEFCIGK
ncbi:MAG TPA: tRNA uridine-5-carboxymethylaminomethyl(34) synthesis GTPase MnmE [Ktedonobacterales bacterium]|nr:tRNA uridine-5-carboxymethylaminomethyl(34) synthesis GTPase MnmE [Ktedonobacterales bacterium]